MLPRELLHTIFAHCERKLVLYLRSKYYSARCTPLLLTSVEDALLSSNHPSWLHEHYTVTLHDVRMNNNRVLRSAAKNGYLHILEWCFDIFSQLDVQDIARDDHYDASQPWARMLYVREACVLHTAAVGGQLHILQWCFETFPELDIHMNNEGVIVFALARGHLHVLQWCFETFPELGIRDIRAHNNELLQAAVSYGHLEILQWCFATFSELDVRDIRCNNQQILRYAARWEQLHVLQWCFATFQELDVRDIRDHYDSPLVIALQRGHICVLQWCFNTFPELGVQDLRDNEFLRYGRKDVVRFFVRKFPELEQDCNTLGIEYQ